MRLFTHVLGHSGWEHFIGNMAYILLLGLMLEETYGSMRILQIIVITAFIITIHKLSRRGDFAYCDFSCGYLLGTTDI